MTTSWFPSLRASKVIVPSPFAGMSIEAVYKRIVNLIERPRPFVKTETYFGPDRRVRERAFEGEDRRAAEAETIEVERKDRAA